VVVKNWLQIYKLTLFLIVLCLRINLSYKLTFLTKYKIFLMRMIEYIFEVSMYIMPLSSLITGATFGLYVLNRKQLMTVGTFSRLYV